MAEDKGTQIKVKFTSLDEWLYIKNGAVLIPEIKCIECGKDATIYDIDPFLEEIYPMEENPDEWWCDDCYQARCDAI